MISFFSQLCEFLPSESRFIYTANYVSIHEKDDFIIFNKILW